MSTPTITPANADSSAMHLVEHAAVAQPPKPQAEGLAASTATTLTSAATPLPPTSTCFEAFFCHIGSCLMNVLNTLIDWLCCKCCSSPSEPIVFVDQTPAVDAAIKQCQQERAARSGGRTSSWEWVLLYHLIVKDFPAELDKCFFYVDKMSDRMLEEFADVALNAPEYTVLHILQRSSSLYAHFLERAIEDQSLLVRLKGHLNYPRDMLYYMEDKIFLFLDKMPEKQALQTRFPNLVMTLKSESLQALSTEFARIIVDKWKGKYEKNQNWRWMFELLTPNCLKFLESPFEAPDMALRARFVYLMQIGCSLESSLYQFPNELTDDNAVAVLDAFKKLYETYFSQDTMNDSATHQILNGATYRKTYKEYQNAFFYSFSSILKASEAKAWLLARPKLTAKIQSFESI